MKDFSQWIDKPRTVTSLLLDTQNPRLPETEGVRTQRDIVADLIETEDVVGLARSIADQGYFPTEKLIGVFQGDHTTIVEGNRRLAALKLLISPELAPDPKVAQFRRLKDRVVLDSIRAVPVIIAPSREAAAPLIIKRHTTTGIERWKPAQQARYIRSIVEADGGVDLDDVARELGITRGELSEELRTDTMYRIACRLKLPPKTQTKVRDARTFSLSTLERLMQSPAALRFLGVTLDDRGGLTGQVEQGAFEKAYSRMVRDIANGKETTRSLNKETDINRYLSDIRADAPDPTRKGIFTAQNLLGQPPQPAPEVSRPSKSHGPVTRREHKALIPPGVRCELKNPRINDVFRELRELRVKSYPNGCAVLLRVLLELALSNRLEKTGRISDLAGRSGKGPNWAPTLRQMLADVLSDSTVTLPPLVRKGINKLVSDDNHPLSLDKMDGFVHSHYIPPAEKDLRNYWALLEPLLLIMLVEPGTPLRGGGR